MQGKPTLTTCTANITIIHPFVTSKGKFPKSADNKFEQGSTKGKYPKRWKPIATKRNIKPQNSASIQGKPTLTTSTGNITVINPVVTSKGKFPKAEDKKFVQGTVKGK
ncbi:hypothetical protein O181_059118 [Austropuccinia psidii MF-1]|uniref:Uncharacterized protein n=1 Tax=Austropuccinia psidii MF-1 TaxID=1389203 RepID=A0A9Q3EI69_9BASI|nr:hypothetical protein [Austropuccinia psidii MF-1]